MEKIVIYKVSVWRSIIIHSLLPLFFLMIGMFNDKGFYFYSIENMSTFRYSFGSGYYMALMFYSVIFSNLYYFVLSIIYRNNYLYTESSKIFLRGKAVCLIDEVDIERTKKSSFWQYGSFPIFTQKGKIIILPILFMVKINDADFLPQ